MVTPILIKYTTPKTLVIVDQINLLYYVLARHDLYSKLEGFTFEKSNWATLKCFSISLSS